MANFDCQVAVPEVNGLEANKITVGRHLTLTCKGDSVAALDFSKISFKPDDKNLFHIFKASASGDQGFSMDFTVYFAGPVKLADHPLTDSVNEIVVNSQSFNVESVIKPPQDGKPPQAFGSILPINLAVPFTYYLILAGAILLAAILSFLKARRLAYYRKLKAKLNQYNSPADPEAQFYRSVRVAEKQGYPLEELEKAFRLYNVRSYKLPLFELNDQSAIRYFKRNYPEHKAARLQLQKLLGEFEALRKNSEKLNADDKNDFVKKLFRYVDHNKGLSL